jgi:hypothetical protein
MTSLYPSLIRLIERAIQSHVEGYSSGIFPGHEEGWPRLGRHFSLQKDGSTVIIYPWFGVYDTALGPIIYIGFNGRGGWCQPVYEAVLTEILSEGVTYRNPYKDLLRTELCFALKEERLEWLKTTEPEEKYEKMLLDFFAEVITFIGQFLR